MFAAFRPRALAGTVLTRTAPFCLSALICAPAPYAQAGGPSVSLICAGEADGHLGPGPVCTPLRALLDRRYAAGGGPEVRLDLVRDDPMHLSGRLIWQATPGQAAIVGPLVEVSSHDRPLDAHAGTRLAQGLVRISDLP